MSSSDDRERLRQEHPGAAAHLPPTGRARVVGGTDGPDQGDPAAWEVLSARGEHVTLSADKSQALAWSAEHTGRTLVPLYRAPGAVAAAPPGDAAAFWAAKPPALGGWTIREAWDALVTRRVPVPPAGHEDDDATEAVLDSIGAVLLTDAPLSVRASAQRVAVLIEVDGWRLVPPAPPAGHEDEAAVERVRTTLAYHVDYEDLDEVTRAALAAARGPRATDLGAGA